MALSFIKSSGNIITEDFCMALASETKAEYVKDKSFGADVKKVDEIIATTFEKLRERWEEHRTQIIENRLDNTELRNKWILPLLKALEYQPVFIASNIKSESGTEYHIPYKGWDSEYAPVIHMVHSAQDFDSKDKHSRTHSNKSPQDCLQQYLNTSHHQWAMLTNGKKLRLLRDFYHSITKGFLEFDLESIFETANTEQFRVFYRIVHRSRIENQYQGEQVTEYDEEGNPIEVEDNCLLESFHKKSRETGVKVGNKLRDQVIEAIEKLGNGFAENLNPDEFQNGKAKAFYGEILNIIYRLLFLMFAEQKGWLPVRNSIYARTYSLNALRERAERGNYNHDEEHDLWEGLKITFQLVAKGYTFINGDTINAFGGQLFSDKKIATIKDLSLKNKYLLDAIFRLSYFKLDNLSNRINYANLAIDELGSVYESLLDYEPKLAKESFAIGKREIKRGEFYLDDRGTDRKTTGSYYTDNRLVAQLIESALVPVIQNSLKDRSTQAEKEAALLDLKVADIACGSGAFICAALEKLGEELALIRMGDEERPTEDQLREAKRDVLLHCIYGVDLNPMAIELAKFSLWITASLPDMPLTFLDHKLKCGNSLIGATPDLIKKGIPEEAYKPVGNDNPAVCTELKKKIRKQLESLNKVNAPQAQYGLQFGRNQTDELLRLREALNNRKQEDSSDVEEVEEEYRRLEKMERQFKDWLMADVWTAAFFIDKTETDLNLYPTNLTLVQLRENEKVNEALIERVLKTADQYHFFHYHLEFPEVFDKGGFDCLLGNPPWEELQAQEKEFFSEYPEIANATATARKKKIDDLKVQSEQLHLDWINYKSTIDRIRIFISESQSFSLSAFGKLNLYSLFAEKFLALVNQSGYTSFITPTDIGTGKSNQTFISSLIKGKYLVSFVDYENSKRPKYFQEVHPQLRFCILTIFKDYDKDGSYEFLIRTDEQLHKNSISLNFDDILLLNPETKTIPVFLNKYEAEIAFKLYSAHPLFGRYNVFPITRVFNIGIPAVLKMFQKEYDSNLPPLFEGKMFAAYNNRQSTIQINEENVIRKASGIDLSISELKDPNFKCRSQYYFKEYKYLNEQFPNNWIIVFKDIGSSTNSRTMISCIIPKVPTDFTIRAITGPINFTKACCTIACFNSFVFDFLLRQKLIGNHLSDYFINQIPVISDAIIGPEAFTKILDNVLKLTYSNYEVKSFAIDCGYTGEPFIWNEKERFQLQCELDAIYAHLYGLEKEELDYILETFPIVRRKDIDKYGSYRTKETILQLYVEFAWVRVEMQKASH